MRDQNKKPFIKIIIKPKNHNQNNNNLNPTSIAKNCKRIKLPKHWIRL